uniref:Uncharacterized protein n=1 Tax=Piliocolobus tephrosceles TaxID=591936 RepID=A0A8C9LM72_9PRIM
MKQLRVCCVSMFLYFITPFLQHYFCGIYLPFCFLDTRAWFYYQGWAQGPGFKRSSHHRFPKCWDCRYDSWHPGFTAFCT